MKLKPVLTYSVILFGLVPYFKSCVFNESVSLWKAAPLSFSPHSSELPRVRIQDKLSAWLSTGWLGEWRIDCLLGLLAGCFDGGLVNSLSVSELVGWCQRLGQGHSLSGKLTMIPVGVLLGPEKLSWEEI